jgi:hypothetical protein
MLSEGAHIAQLSGFSSPSTGKAGGASLLDASHSLALSLPFNAQHPQAA